MRLVLLCLVPIVLAPLLLFALRRTFTIFVREGDELFGNKLVSESDGLDIACTLARWNVSTFIVFWVAFFVCRDLQASPDLLMFIALVGIAIAFITTVLLVHMDMGLRGWGLCGVGLVSFAGGNLPLIILLPLLLVGN